VPVTHRSSRLAASPQQPRANPISSRAAADRDAQRRRRLVRWAAPAILALVAAAVGAYVFTRGSEATDATTSASPVDGPRLGGDLHTVSVVGRRLFLGGHAAVASSEDGGATWQLVATLRAADAMGWAVTSSGILVGGHPGLYRSIDGGKTFSRQNAAAAPGDVHALGGVGDRVYLASPQSGLLTSADGGRSWRVLNDRVGRSFMGTILVDPRDPARLVVPDMSSGVMMSGDAGRSWTSLGGPMGAMAVGWNPTNTKQIIAVGMNGAERSTDGGLTWKQADLPNGTRAVSYDPTGATVYVGVAVGGLGVAYRSTDDGATWTVTS
jgi:photosystem II stability/assembly factor-like uncharacterized protein